MPGKVKLNAVFGKSKGTIYRAQAVVYVISLKEKFCPDQASMIIRTYSYPRAAVMGNPSDGYFGKTIAFIFSNYRAEVTLYDSPELEIVPQERDKLVFSSTDALCEDVRFFGYYGGIRLIKATIKRFAAHVERKGIRLARKNFTIRYQSDIPGRLGLAGSSAIITAAMRALMRFYDISLPLPELANLVLSVETEELGIGAGLQDRVAQAYETPIFMDFDRAYMEEKGWGRYQPLHQLRVASWYLAFRTDLAEGSEVVHNDLRSRFDKGDPVVVKAMRGFANLTDQALDALNQKDLGRLGDLINQNFDLRASIMQISQRNAEMVKLARSVGASAKFTGSGGAIIGTVRNQQMFDTLRQQMEAAGIIVIRPTIVYK